MASFLLSLVTGLSLNDIKLILKNVLSGRHSEVIDSSSGDSIVKQLIIVLFIVLILIFFYRID